MKLLKHKLALVGMLALAASVVVLAQNSDPAPTTTPEEPKKPGRARPLPRNPDKGPDPRLDTMPWEVIWTTDKWTSDDKPYIKARQAIEKSIAEGQSAESLRLKYKKAAAKNLENPLALFRWGYAAYLASPTAYDESTYNINETDSQRAKRLKDSLELDNRTAELENPLIHISRAINFSRPKTYNFARMQFLIQGGGRGSYSAYMKKLAERLLKHDPEDLEVRYRYADVLFNWGGGPLEVKKALKIVEELVKIKPNNVNFGFLLGLLYEDAWMRSKSRADAEKAIGIHKKYYQLRASESKKPPGDYRIKFIQERQAMFEKEKLEADKKP